MEIGECADPQTERSEMETAAARWAAMTVAGACISKSPERPRSARELATAFLTAKKTDAARAYGGSPAALERRTPAGLGASG